MTLAEMKKKALSLIEELNPQSEQLTDDPDIQAKQNHVINQIMFELCRIKRIPKYLEMEVRTGQVVTLEDLADSCDYAVYKVDRVSGAAYTPKAQGTVLKFLEDGTAEVELFVYPERITEKTRDRAYEFELSEDVLEIMPYGIAADLLKSDISADYGSVYAARYAEMRQELDTQYQMPSYTVEGGVDI